MLNLTIAMRRYHLLIILAVLLPGFLPAAAQEPQPSVWLNAPTGGEALQGNVSIEIEINAETIRSLELAFRYTGSDFSNWFTIYESSQVTLGNLEITWDTTTISDGNYDLRFRALLSNDEELESIIEGIRVRNYSAIETNTPTASPIPGSTAEPTETPPPTSTKTTIPPTITALPPNPAAVTTSRLVQTLIQGGVATLLAIGLLGLYSYLSRQHYDG